VAEGAADMIQQQDLTAEKLASLLTDWLADAGQLQQRALNARKLARPDVAETMAEICEEVCRGR
jgi:UDP-N-acetylglucosamine--N-acetylmuramyl-(pentapeptide) pyrophosphoryl-undecaprenol N-acetylglucosamine transferase